MIRSSFDEVIGNADTTQLQLMKEMCIQVDEKDNIIGPISKKDAHWHDGILHRAFSVFVFNSKNELLIQKRSKQKITFPEHWANTCCSHPLHVEDEMQDGIGVKKAAIRKLEHELGIPLTTFNVSSFRYIGSVLYKASSDVNWAEFELDHILLARGDINVQVNSNEVAEYAYVSKNALDGILRSEDRLLSPWFRLIARSQLPIWWDNLDTLLEKDDAKPVIYDMR
ncbi:unnamed protein product [Albugo candida]|nr:unnamed protein product [Albugo candida]|eukprot:CCI48049.1 unnamed protein product [Albugo candida]